MFSQKEMKNFSRVYAHLDFFERFKHQSHKMVKHTQTIRRQFADELFVCVWPFCEIGA